MCRGDGNHDSMFSYESREARVSGEHPLRPMRAMVDRALLVQILFSIRSERQLMEQPEYDLMRRPGMPTAPT